jgi:hypothetical protein
MRETKRTCVAVLAASAILLMGTAASALPTINMIWRAPGVGANIGTATGGIGPSSTIFADIVLVADGVNTVTGVFISIAFDPTELFALGAQELNPVSLPGMGNQFSPISTGVFITETSPGVQAGTITNFDQQTTATGITTGTRTLGSVKFHVIAATGTGEDDVIANLSNVGTDTISTPTGDITANFNGASVNGPVVPEPTTAILVIAGLAGLGYAGRRNFR